MNSDELVSTIGVGYLDEMNRDLESDSETILGMKESMRPESQNLANKVISNIKVLRSSIALLQDMIMKESGEI